MPIKIERKCPRCHRDNALEVESATAAVKAEEKSLERDGTADAIREYLSTIAPDLMPDAITYTKGGGLLIHVDLCNPADAKRSCQKRVDDLAEAISTLDERKPRAKKAE